MRELGGAEQERAADLAAEFELLMKDARARGRRRLLRNAALVGLLAAAIAGGVVVIGRGRHRGLRSAESAAARPVASSRSARWPEFFADTVLTAEANSALQIRTSVTGGLLEAALDTPRGTFSQVLALTATGADGFVVALRQGSPRDTSSTSCVTQLDRLRLNARGRFESLTRIGPALSGYVGSLAASRGGRMIGYSLIDGMCVKGAPNYLGVLDSTTGRTRQWSEKALLGAGAGYVGSMGGLSMTADGRELMFSAAVSRSYRSITASEVRILRTDADSAARASRVVLLTRGNRVAFIQAIIDPDGRSFYLTSATAAAKSLERSQLLAYRIGSTKPYATLATFAGTPYGAALDPSGQWLLMPYKLDQGTARTNWRGGLDLARINTANGTRTRIFIPLTGFGGMSPPGGMLTAW